MKEELEKSIEDFLSKRTDLFVLEITISADNRVAITLDGDHGVNIKDCTMLSKHIEAQIDREEIDYALEVSSYGLSNPLIHPRQYTKNLNRKLKVQTDDATYKGTLILADNNDITLQWKKRVPKAVGKGKITQTFEQNIKLKNIQKAQLIISF